VILAGVKAVTLQETEACAIADLGANFYLAEADVGKNRAEACAAKLQELNPAVEVTVVTDDVTEDLVKKHQVRQIARRARGPPRAGAAPPSSLSDPDRGKAHTPTVFASRPNFRSRLALDPTP
jgi:hypothetical protein